MLIPRMLFLPHTASLNGSAQFGTVESLEHILRSLFATVGTSRPHTRCIQPGAPSWGCRAAVAIASPAGEPRCPNSARQHPRASEGQSAQACPRGSWLERSATCWAAGNGDAAGLKRPKGAPQTLTSLGAAGERADPCSCPSPLPLCNRLPELLTFRSPGHKARRVVVWRV